MAKQQVVNPAQMQKIVQTKEKIAQLKAAEQYNEALEEIIALFDGNSVDTELLFETADIYWLSGDYERAAVWAEKTLSFSAKHPQAQLLLAKVYGFQDKESECLKALDQFFEGREEISDEMRSEVEDLLEYFDVEDMDEKLEGEYPDLWRFVQGDVSSESSEPDVSAFAPEERAEIAAKPLTQERPYIAQAEAFPTLSATVASHAEQKELDPYACLYHRPIEAVIQAILAQPLSLVGKVDLFLHFAVYYYTRCDTAKTIMLLKQAYLIDDHDPLVLKNIGFVLSQMGDKAGALEFLPKIKEKDLMVLHQIKVLSGK